MNWQKTISPFIDFREGAFKISKIRHGMETRLMSSSDARPKRGKVRMMNDVGGEVSDPGPRAGGAFPTGCAKPR